MNAASPAEKALKMDEVPKDEAFVLWLDMLGYKSWLTDNADLERAEDQLLGAIEFAFARASVSEEAAAVRSEVHTLLISDTIIIWTFSSSVSAVQIMVVTYQLLFNQLASLGLPLRGVFTRGALRIRQAEPRIILGSSIVTCATVEPRLQAFAVVFAGPVLEHPLSDLEMPQMTYWSLNVSPVTILTKDGPQTVYVLKWFLPDTPLTLCKHMRLLQDAVESGAAKPEESLIPFAAKLLGSCEMINTVMAVTFSGGPEGTRHKKRANREWKKAVGLAQVILKQAGSPLAEMVTRKG